ncbi:MAG: ABC transporter ATP-binding protein [Oscillospiraceae bacterium]|nr:ABC transporter ATP-binding protein [Oscillospiraceae bacterium]
MTKREPLLEVRNLSIAFRMDRKTKLDAVRDLSFCVYPGETLGILGESGCGKSVTCMSILKLLPARTTIYNSGDILFEGQSLLNMPEKKLSKIRGNEISMIFQEPMTSLNPLLTVGDQLMEILRIHDPKMDKQEAYRRALEAVTDVRIPNPERILESYPFTMSGGMLQRIMIAMAMLNKPKLLICDEPTTALDVTIQAQVLDLMNRLKEESGTSIIIVTHDLGVISEMSDRVMVMYGGRKCEEGIANDVFFSPRHPYTQGLIASHPSASLDKERLPMIPGSVPSLKDMPKGCPFNNRCPYATESCGSLVPQQEELGDSHIVCCHRWKEVTPVG